MNTFAKDPKTQQKALLKALQSPQIGKHGPRKETLALNRALDKKAESIVEEMMSERSRAMGLLKKKIDKASYRDLIHALDTLNKNIQLLSGENTSKFGMGAELDALEAEDENRVKFEWRQ